MNGSSKPSQNGEPDDSNIASTEKSLDGSHESNVPKSDVPPLDVSKSNKTDDKTVTTTEEAMEVDDPEIFGPFTHTQLHPIIQNETDQDHFDSFQDSMTLLKTAIGRFLYINLFFFFFTEIYKGLFLLFRSNGDSTWCSNPIRSCYQHHQ